MKIGVTNRLPFLSDRLVAPVTEHGVTSDAVRRLLWVRGLEKLVVETYRA